ncbi:MAG: monooxygenase, partial [Curvibacter sp.]
MHQPTTLARTSIYYDYEVHQPWLPSQNGQQERAPVAIVGAGPAALVSALKLAHLGVSSVVLA